MHEETIKRIEDPCDHHSHGKSVNRDLEESPNRALKAVQFDNQVRVREYESMQARKLLFRSPEEQRNYPYSNHNESQNLHQV